MRKSILLLLFLALHLSLTAQSAAEKEVSKSVEVFRQAMIDEDQVILEKLLATELSYGHSSGTIESKADFLEVIANGKTDYKTFDLSNQTIIIVDQVALVRHTLVTEIENSGVTNTIKLGVLLVWKKNTGRWQLLARQAYKL